MSVRKFSDQARRLLSDWQTGEYRRLGLRLPGESDFVKVASQIAALHGYNPGTAEYDAIGARTVALYRETQSSAPTPYESPYWFGLATLLVQDVEHAARARSLALPVTPLFGTIPSGMVNATTCYLPETGEYLIVFAAGLFLFLNLMAKLTADAAVAAAEAMSPGRALDYTKLPQILADDRFHDRFFDALYSHVVLGNAGLARQYTLEEPAHRLAGGLRNTMELFIVAHEYGHIIEGHLTALPQKPSPSTTESGEFVYEPAWYEELAADDRATDLVIQIAAIKNVHPHVVVASIHLVLFCLELVDLTVNALMASQSETAAIMDTLVNALPILHEGERPGDSHPSAASRRFKQRGRFHDLLGADLADEGNEMGTDLITALQYLWTASRPRWVALRESGVKPCPLWDPRVQT